MGAPIFLGDELSASAYRLAGLRVRTPEPGEAISLLHWARSEAPLVLLSAGYAAQLPPRELQRAQAALVPPVVVVPDIRGVHDAPDLAQRLRRTLGLEA